MARIVGQNEALPEAWPDPPALSAEAAALDAGAIWQRIESYIAHRFTPRQVVWLVEGPGTFDPPLVPCTLGTTEVWDGSSWAECTLAPSPRGGLILPGCGSYRFTASVGAAPAPAAVLEAFRRLAEFLGEDFNTVLAVREEVNLGGVIKQAVERPVTWMARALQLSGAADLLRPYRRA